MTRLSLLIILFVLVFNACKKEEVKVIPIRSPGVFGPAIPLIDPELAPYIDRFKEEAEKRGLNLPFSHLRAYLVKGFSVDVSEYVCGIGFSNHLGSGDPRVEISERCWKNATNEQREVLMLHELGHAMLDRDHLDSRLYNGSGAKSIMCSSSCRNLLSCYDNWPLKDYYIDELFDPKTLAPDFIKKNNFVRTVFEEDFEKGIDDDWEFSYLGNNGDTANINYLPLLDSLNSKDATKSLALYSRKVNSEEEIMVVSKEFDLSDFTNCSNLRASANIDLSNLRIGYLEMHLALNTKAESSFLNTYYIDFNSLNTEDRNTNISKNINLDLEVFCITERLETVAIVFQFFSRTEATAYIRDIKVDLIE